MVRPGFWPLKSVEELRVLEGGRPGAHPHGPGIRGRRNVGLHVQGEPRPKRAILAGRKVKGRRVGAVPLLPGGNRRSGAAGGNTPWAAPRRSTVSAPTLSGSGPIMPCRRPLFSRIFRRDRFELPSPLEALRELELFISNLDTRSMLLSDHSVQLSESIGAAARGPTGIVDRIAGSH